MRLGFHLEAMSSIERTLFCILPRGRELQTNGFLRAAKHSRRSWFFSIVHGSGQVFGPYFLKAGVNLNQYGYKRLLSHTVFPDMKRRLGQAEFDSTCWQQDGAKPHTANSNMDYLDGIFGPNMLALKSRQ